MRELETLPEIEFHITCPVHSGQVQSGPVPRVPSPFVRVAVEFMQVHEGIADPGLEIRAELIAQAEGGVETVHGRKVILEPEFFGEGDMKSFDNLLVHLSRHPCPEIEISILIHLGECGGRNRGKNYRKNHFSGHINLHHISWKSLSRTMVLMVLVSPAGR